MSAVTEYFRDEGRKDRDIEIAIIMIKNNEPDEKIALLPPAINY